MGNPTFDAEHKAVEKQVFMYCDKQIDKMTKAELIEALKNVGTLYHDLLQRNINRFKPIKD